MTSTTAMRILVVDDERIIADTLAKILHTRGFITRAVYSAEEATDVANQFQPALLISDVMMPGMNGLDLADWFAHHFPVCKVLLITGNAGAAELVLEQKHQSSPVILSKPIHPEEILRIVASSASAH